MLGRQTNGPSCMSHGDNRLKSTKAAAAAHLSRSILTHQPQQLRDTSAIGVSCRLRCSSSREYRQNARLSSEKKNGLSTLSQYQVGLSPQHGTAAILNSREGYYWWTQFLSESVISSTVQPRFATKKTKPFSHDRLCCRPYVHITPTDIRASINARREFNTGLNLARCWIQKG